MQGYWKAPEETARALRDGWLHTGDIARKDAQGYMYIVDRKKEMIKYKGFGIAPAELEALLHEHPGGRRLRRRAEARCRGGRDPARLHRAARQLPASAPTS